MTKEERYHQTALKWKAEFKEKYGLDMDVPMLIETLEENEEEADAVCRSFGL